MRNPHAQGHSHTSNGLDDTVELLRSLIRQACVNDGTPQGAQEIRSVRLLQRFFSGSPVELQVFESSPGRASLVARVRGSDPNAPALGLLGHLDVVPVAPTGWNHDPFGGDVIDGEVWGRGAVDMLYLTAVFATVLREVANGPTQPRGDLVLMAVADEEAGGDYGLRWLLREHPDALAVTEVLSESGGMRIGNHVAIGTAEKGSAGRRLIVRGTPGHASIPYGARSAVQEIGQVLQRLAEVQPAVILGPLWSAFVSARVSDAELAERLLDPVRLDAALPELQGLAGYAHAVSRVTLSPTMVRAGVAHNVIPALGTIDLDIRTLPGTTDAAVDELLHLMLGDLLGQVEIEPLMGWAATGSASDSPLFHAIEAAISEVAGVPTVPIMAAGGSDARQFRELGIPSYGFGLLGPDWTYEKYREGVHSNNERISIESIDLTLQALRHIVAARVGA